jgi:tocopherol cyclase-like protein
VSEADNVPRTPGRHGTYEVWFLTFTDPVSGTGYWIRSTLTTSPDGARSAGAWFARFDRADPSRTVGIHVTTREATVATDAFDVEVGGTVMRSGLAAGAVAGGGHDASWDLVYATGGPTFAILPEALARSSFVSTHSVSPNPATRISGSVRVDDHVVAMRDVPAHQGHVFGTRHAERWAWASCSDFVGADAAIEAVTAKARRGPFATPYATFVGIRWQGTWIRFARVARRPDFDLGSWRVDLESRRYRLTGRVEAPARDLIRARYEDPDGRARSCHNSEVASCRLALFERRPGGLEEVGLLESRGTTHAEWAGLTPARTVERAFVEVDA